MRYAFDNDDSDVENEVETNLRPIDVNLTSTLSQPVTLLVGMQGPGSAYIEALKCATQHIGDINVIRDIKFHPSVKFAYREIHD